MNKLIPMCALALACVLPAGAQDNTVRTRTTIKTDDAKVVTMTGCLQQNYASNSFSLVGALGAAGDDLKSKTKVKTDVGRDATTVKTTTRTKVDSDAVIGTAGAMTTFSLMPKEGLTLVPHVGHRVEISAIMLDPGEDDAEVKITERTEVKVDDAPDAKRRTRTKVDIERNGFGRYTAVSVRHIAPPCS